MKNSIKKLKTLNKSLKKAKDDLKVNVSLNNPYYINNDRDEERKEEKEAIEMRIKGLKKNIKGILINMISSLNNKL